MKYIIKKYKSMTGIEYFVVEQKANSLMEFIKACPIGSIVCSKFNYNEKKEINETQFTFLTAKPFTYNGQLNVNYALINNLEEAKLIQKHATSSFKKQQEQNKGIIVK